MNKITKFLSAVLAGCMMVATVAGAADISAEKEEMVTYTGVATVIADDGSSVDKDYEFTAPADAAQDELRALNQAAAREAAHGKQGRSYIQSENLAYEEDVDIPQASRYNGYLIRGSRITYEPEEIEVLMYGVTGCGRVNVAIQNRSDSSEKDYDTYTPSNGFCRATFISTSACSLVKGQRYNFYFSGNSEGHADSIDISYNYRTA